MIENVDGMAIAGMLFAILFLGLATWFVATMGKKSIDYQQAKYVARSSNAREIELRRMAEEATRAQQEIAERLKRLESIEARLSEVERMLREVDDPVAAR